VQIPDGQNWYFAATAYRQSAEYGFEESALSDEIALFDSDISPATDVAVNWEQVRMANNFSGDPHCKALWRFENGALTADSIGTNTLTAVNSPVADTANYKEGSASVDLESGSAQRFYILDADLNAGFPLKSGDTTKNISVACWIRIESTREDNNAIFSKHDYGANKRSFAIHVYGASTRKILLLLGYNSGASYEALLHATDLSLGTWYHVSVSYQNSDKAWAIRVRDASGNTVGTDATGTATLDANKLFVANVSAGVGCVFNNGSATNLFDGLIDELVVFDDILTAEEATQIAQGTYGSGAASAMLKMMMAHHN
jgi:hypothetical protein